MGDKRPPEERLKLPLDPEEALRALLRVDPESEPAEGTQSSANPNDDSKTHQ